MRIKSLVCLGIFLTVVALAGCGGGGDGGAGDSTPTPPGSTTTSGVLKLNTDGTAATMGAIDVTVNFPAGVKVNADAFTGETASNVVTVSGVAAVGDNKLASARFTPASGATSAQLHIIVINATGFGLGEFVTIRFDLDAGVSMPAASAFTVADFSPKALADGTPLTGMTAAPASVAGI